MKYFSYISNSYSLKNRLEKSIYSLLHKNNRRIIDASELDAFKQKITDGIEALNKQYNRCKPFRVDWYQPNYSKDDIDIHLHLGGTICHFHLYGAKS